MKVEEQTEEERGRQTQRTPVAKGRLIIERSRSRDRSKSEAKSEAKSEPKSEPKSETQSVKRERFKDKKERTKTTPYETPKDKKERKRKSPPEKIDVKTEIDRINAQTVTKEDIDALQKTVRKHLEDNPEDAHEPRGKRGRPKIIQETGASSSASSSKAPASAPEPKKESWDATLWDGKTGKTYWKTRQNAYIVNQLRLRGYDNSSEWQQIKKLTKDGLLKMVNDLIDNDKW